MSFTPFLRPESIVAHRGGAREAAENTLSAVSRALRLGVRAIEIDVQLTADGEVVVFHDDAVPKAGDPDTMVPLSSIPARDVLAWNVGGRFGVEAPPLLSDVLALDWPPSTRLMIEAKHGAGDDGLAAAVARQVAASRARPSIVWGSITPSLLETLAVCDAAIPRVAILPNTRDFDAFMRLRPAILALGSRSASPEVVSMLKSTGQETWIWTVNELEDARRYREAGFDAVVTDRPGFFCGC